MAPVRNALRASGRVRVGGGQLEDALSNTAMQPFVWASAAALWLSYSGSPLPAWVHPESFQKVDCVSTFRLVPMCKVTSDEPVMQRLRLWLLYSWTL